MGAFDDSDPVKVQKWEDDFAQRLVASVRGPKNEALVTDAQARSYFRTYRDALKPEFTGGTYYGQYDQVAFQTYVDRVATAASSIERQIDQNRPPGIANPDAGKERVLWSEWEVGQAAASSDAIRQTMGIGADKLWLEGSGMGKLMEAFQNSGKATFGADYPPTKNFLGWSGVSRNFANGAKGKVDMIMPAHIGMESVAWNTEINAVRKKMQPIASTPEVSQLTVHNLAPAVNQKYQDFKAKLSDTGKALAEVEAAIGKLPANPTGEDARELDRLKARKALLVMQQGDLETQKKAFLGDALKQKDSWVSKPIQDATLKVAAPTPAQSFQFLLRHQKKVAPPSGNTEATIKLGKMVSYAQAWKAYKRPVTAKQKAAKKAVDTFVEAVPHLAAEKRRRGAQVKR